MAKPFLVLCFGLEWLDFEESSYSQISACKANSSQTELSIPNNT